MHIWKNTHSRMFKNLLHLADILVTALALNKTSIRLNLSKQECVMDHHLSQILQESIIKEVSLVVVVVCVWRGVG